jgi:hypothetical protein
MTNLQCVGRFLDGFFGKKPVPYNRAFRCYSHGQIWSCNLIVALVVGVPWITGALYLAGVV